MRNYCSIIFHYSADILSLEGRREDGAVTVGRHIHIHDTIWSTTLSKFYSKHCQFLICLFKERFRQFKFWAENSSSRNVPRISTKTGKKWDRVLFFEKEHVLSYLLTYPQRDQIDEDAILSCYREKAGSKMNNSCWWGSTARSCSLWIILIMR